jgi:hypothetical protein
LALAPTGMLTGPRVPIGTSMARGCRCRYNAAPDPNGYFRTYFCTRQFRVSATKTSSRGLTAM